MSRFAVLLFALLYAAAGNKAKPEEAPFTIVVLPDTQYYSKYEENAHLFTEQTQWIADEIEHKGNPRNIVFVSHLGDVVNDGWSEEQWVRANASLSEMGPPGGPFVVPFGILPGNHDFFVTFQKNTGAAKYVENCGPKRFANAPWYGGADPSGLNSFQFFSGGGFKFLHVALEWGADRNAPVRDPSPIEWASKVILDHPSLPVILSTHEYILDRPAGRSDVGDAIFEKLVKTHDQIFLVLSGHFHNYESGGPSHATRMDGEWHQVSKNEVGRPVIEVLQDYQDYPNGGDGWLRLLTFDVSAGELRFETCSPALGQYAADTVAESGQRASKFTIPLDFAKRFRSPPVWPFGHFSGSFQNTRRGAKKSSLSQQPITVG